MKKFLSALLVALMLLSVTACAAHEPVLPPSRWGEMQINSMFERYYSVSDAFREADAVARVRVGDWQGEDLRNWVTFFDASVQESYKGELPRNFTLVQGGCLPAEPSFWFSCGTMTAAGKNITPSPTITRCCMSCMTKPEAGISWTASAP